MLTFDQLDALTVPITDLYEEYIQTVINDIARRLVKMGKPTITAAWQLQRLQESGAVYKNAIKELSRLTGQSEQILKETFEAAGVQTMRFDDAIYKAAGLNPLPLHLSPAMTQVLAAGLQKTGGIINNLTMTTATSAQQAFIHAADIAYMQVTTGVLSYDEAIKRAIRGVGGDGLLITYPSGHRDQLDVAMRRTVLTGVSQTSGELQMTRANEMGSDLVQVSAHIGARPEHAAWQGKIYSRSGTDRSYPDFVKSTKYGTGEGLMGWNCRHSFYPYFKGISKPLYDGATMRNYEKKTVQYQKKDIPIYDATQRQREIERYIRGWKRQENTTANALAQAKISQPGSKLVFELERDLLKSKSRVKDWQEVMRDFVNETGLQRQSVRERIVLL